ncbi:MAG: aldolase [Heliobacteriaceae bacterium]|nr:aldolase [Heliobacteriaceae bacterium]MDD4588168.1 aldolase [Heliobacteriaceae bacterium]
MLKEFQQIGRDLFLAGLNNSHSGNMSIRMGDRIIITRRGAQLGRLTARDLIETGLTKNDSRIALASTEIKVHRAIYARTAALAICHAHPPYATALSLTQTEIIPVDSEGSYFTHKIPVFGAELTIGSQEVAAVIPEILQAYKVAMLKGHGIFAVGQLLEEAYQLVSSVEHSCKILWLARQLPGGTAGSLAAKAGW